MASDEHDPTPLSELELWGKLVDDPRVVRVMLGRGAGIDSVVLGVSLRGLPVPKVKTFHGRQADCVLEAVRWLNAIPVRVDAEKGTR